MVFNIGNWNSTLFDNPVLSLLTKLNIFLLEYDSMLIVGQKSI